MTLNELYLAILAAAPSLVSIIGIIISILKMLKASYISNKQVIDKFEEMRQEVFNTKEYNDLKDQLVIAHQENAELKKTINELLTKIDHVARK